MPTKLTWLGHNTWLIETAGHKIIIDPFLDDSPTATMKAADVEADFIVVSHGHFDHVGHHRTGRRHHAGTTTIEHDLADSVTKH